MTAVSHGRKIELAIRRPFVRGHELHTRCCFCGTIATRPETSILFPNVARIVELQPHGSVECSNPLSRSRVLALNPIANVTSPNASFTDHISSEPKACGTKQTACCARIRQPSTVSGSSSRPFFSKASVHEWWTLVCSERPWRAEPDSQNDAHSVMQDSGCMLGRMLPQAWEINLEPGTRRFASRIYFPPKTSSIPRMSTTVNISHRRY